MQAFGQHLVVKLSVVLVLWAGMPEVLLPVMNHLVLQCRHYSLYRRKPKNPGCIHCSSTVLPCSDYKALGMVIAVNALG